MQSLPDWLWLLVGGGILGGVLARLWGRGSPTEAAKAVAGVVTRQAEQQEQATKAAAAAEHKQATDEAQAASEQVAGADAQELADLVNATFGGSDE